MEFRLWGFASELTAVLDDLRNYEIISDQKRFLTVYGRDVDVVKINIGNVEDVSRMIRYISGTGVIFESDLFRNFDMGKFVEASVIAIFSANVRVA